MSFLFPLFRLSFFSRFASFPALLACCAFPALLLFPPFSPSIAHADDAPFIHPTNWGGTGLMEIPSARVMEENSVRFGYSQIYPYRYYYGAVSPLKGLEIDLRITEILDSPVENDDPDWEGYGNKKDKAMDFKYQVVPEGKYVPAVAIGFMDPHGTRKYPSQYIVASKQIYPFDFTIGFGNGRFGDKPLPAQGEGIKIEMFSETDDWLRDSNIFWGIEFSPLKQVSLLLEYSPVKYHEQTSDPAQADHFEGPVSSQYNVGLRLKPVDWFEVTASYQRGEEFGVNAVLAFDIGKSLLPIYDQPYMEDPELMLNPFIARMEHALYVSGFSDINVVVEGKTALVEAQNDTYYFSTRAIDKILELLHGRVPSDIEEINIVLKENGIPQIAFHTVTADVEDYLNDRMSIHELYSLAEIRTDTTHRGEGTASFRKRQFYGLKPSVETFLNDPSGFFKYRLGLSGWAGYHPWDGATLVSSVEGYPVNNIETVNEPLSIPVRSDLVLYKKEDVALGRLLYDQIYKADHEIYAKLSAGLLEIQYAGIDGELATPVLDGRLLLGVGGSIVKKREPGKPLKLKDDPVKDYYTTAFVNTRLNIPEIDITLDVKAGRFLAGDPGVRFTVSKFINGVILRAWYSITDTSDFTDTYNDGYRDKGISISIPLKMILGKDSRTVYHYSLSPWLRDTGQDIDHYGTLFDVIDRKVKLLIDKDRQMIYR